MKRSTLRLYLCRLQISRGAGRREASVEGEGESVQHVFAMCVYEAGRAETGASDVGNNQTPRV